jgi:monoamine oxidase
MRVAVIGSGIAGLSAAHDLRKAGFEVVVLERDRIPGGRMADTMVGSLRVNTGASILFTFCHDMLPLVQELYPDLERDLVEVHSQWWDDMRRWEAAPATAIHWPWRPSLPRSRSWKETAMPRTVASQTSTPCSRKRWTESPARTSRTSCSRAFPVPGHSPSLRRRRSSITRTGWGQAFRRRGYAPLS